VLTGSQEGIARLWDATTGQPIGPSLKDTPRVISVTLGSPANLDGLLKKLGIQDGYGSMRVAFSPDGKIFAAGSSGGTTVRLWGTSAPLPDNPPRIAAWVQTITGLELDELGVARALDSVAWRQRKQLLDQLGGPPPGQAGLSLDPILFGADPTARARAWAERKRCVEAEAAFDESVRCRPTSAGVWAERGWHYRMRSESGKSVADFVESLALGSTDSNLLDEIIATDADIDRALAKVPSYSTWLLSELLLRRAERLAKRGRWDRAAADLQEAARLAQLDTWIASRAVSVLLVGDDRDGLWRFSTDLLKRFRDTTDPATANNVAWSLVLSPAAVTSADLAVSLAERAVNGSPTKDKHLALITLGAALYRAGRFEGAILRLAEGVQLRERVAVPEDCAFLAMAHDRLGHVEDARRWLDKLRNRQPSTQPDDFWKELEIRLLRSEADAVILHDPVFPTDPFAH
jgi:tetratricopeptide (TPR) repeat protein